MKTYRIACSWTMVGTMEVEAESFEEAIRKAEEDEPLPNGDYLEESFRVDMKLTEELNDLTS